MLSALRYTSKNQNYKRYLTGLTSFEYALSRKYYEICIMLIGHNLDSREKYKYH